MIDLGPIHPYRLVSPEVLENRREEPVPHQLREVYQAAAWQRGESERRKWRWYLSHRENWIGAVEGSLLTVPEADDEDRKQTQPVIMRFSEQFRRQGERSLNKLRLPSLMPYSQYLVALELVWPTDDLSFVEVKPYAIVAPPELLSAVSSEPRFQLDAFLTHPMTQDFCEAAKRTGRPQPLIISCAGMLDNPQGRCGFHYRRSLYNLTSRVNRRLREGGCKLSFLSRHQRAVILGSAGRPGRFIRTWKVDEFIWRSAQEHSIQAFACRSLVSPLSDQEIEHLVHKQSVIVEVGYV